MKSIRLLTCFAAFLLSTSVAALALDRPTGPVVLTVKGSVSKPNVGATAQFDLAMLEALSGRTGTMNTPWIDGKTAFSGPYLRAILEAAGATGKTLQVRALNASSTSFLRPVSTASRCLSGTRGRFS
jgi:hypothetical protein